MTTRLFLFQIGPVQAFIAQARRTQDLFLGSHILSKLASAGMLAASRSTGFEPLFPLVQNDHGAPHRFSFLSADDPHEIAATVRQAIETRWLDSFATPVYELVQRAVGGGDWQEVFKRQATGWLEFYWAAVDYDAGNHGASFRRVSTALAQRKYARTYHVVEEAGIKCTLTGTQAALDLNWDRLRKEIGDKEGKVLRDNERLGTLALIKRLAAIAHSITDNDLADFEGFPSTNEIAADQWGVRDSGGIGKEVTGYLAVLHMDGDQMGQRLSGLRDLKDHQKFSRDLAAYAAEGAPITVEHFGGELGRLVYSGGDDVLALLPLKHVLRCADELRQLFSRMTECTASAGIAITPANLPLDRALELAREAEEQAKEQYGRNAVVVVEAHGSGQMRPAGGKWDIIPFVNRLQELFERGTLSAKLGYDLQMVDYYLFGDLRDARIAEVKRLVGRRTAEGVTADQKQAIEAMTGEMIELVENKRAVPTWSNMANWVILARFLAQGSRS